MFRARTAVRRPALLATVVTSILLASVTLLATASGATGTPMLSVFAGTGTSGSPTPGPATSSRLGDVYGVAVDAAGNVFIADCSNHVIEKVDVAGNLTIVAGDGMQGAPTAGPATASRLGCPRDIAVIPGGGFYVADMDSHLIAKVDAAGNLSIVAGTGTSGTPTEGQATSSDMKRPVGLALDAAGRLFVADDSLSQVLLIDTTGMLSIVAGTGVWGTPTVGPAASSRLASPMDVAIDSSGNLYIADFDNRVIEKVTPSGTLSIVAGLVAQAGAPTPGPASASKLKGPVAIAVDAFGRIFIADSGATAKVLMVDTNGVLSVFAGSGSWGAPTPGPATASDIGDPLGLAVSAVGDLLIADLGNAMILRVTAADPPPTSSTIATTTVPVGPTTTVPSPTTSTTAGVPTTIEAADPVVTVPVDDPVAPAFTG